jgi:short subunit dehydrogenase-like uncharacterized protein
MRKLVNYTGFFNLQKFINKNRMILVYGAYGYTGTLIVEELTSKGHKPIIAGRNAQKVQEMSQKFNLEAFTLEVNQTQKLLDVLSKVKVVIHCGGPFIYTAEDMANACLESGVHYIDITGEHQVFELMHQLDAKAKEKGIVLLPGAGFDVVPSDCLALHLKSRLPDATHIQLAFSGVGGGISRGTMKTSLTNMGGGSLIRKNGVLTSIPFGKKLKVNFGKKELDVANIPWGDVSTAYHSTGIPNVECYAGIPGAAGPGAKILSQILKVSFIKNIALKWVDKNIDGPSQEKRARSKVYFWGKVWNEKGESKVSTMIVSDGYTLTAQTASDAALRIVNGEFKVGFQTPSSNFGKDYVLNFPNCERTDIA